MRLLVVSREFPPHVVGGISHHLNNLYKKLSQMGHDISIIAGRCSDYRVGEECDELREIDIEWVDYPTLSAHHLQFPLLVWNKLRSMDLSNYDALLSHTELPFSVDLPVVAKCHDMKQEDREYVRNNQSRIFNIGDRIINPTRKVVDRRSIKFADQLIFNSNLTKSLWSKYYNLPQEKSNIIHNGVDTDVFFPKSRGDKGYILFVGSGERKGVSKVQEFAEKTDFLIKTVGNNDLHGENISSLSRVDQDQLAELYSGAKVTIHPANFEAFGNVILESLACGTPVVVSNRCGASEIIDSSCGVVTNNIKQGVQKAERIDPSCCIKKATNYTWGNVAMRTEDVVKEAVLQYNNRSR